MRESNKKMLGFNISVFRFDAERDYNAYFQKLEICIVEDSSLQDLMELLSQKLDNFSYDKEFFAFRINEKVIFENVSVVEIYEYFGENLYITPISTKYAMKDLLVDKEAIFEQYRAKLDNFDFISSECKEEFKKYILINLVSPIEWSDYVGDGYCLYIKWMMIHYKEHSGELLDSIAQIDGVMNSLPTKYMIFPPTESIDNEIKELQTTLLRDFSEKKINAMIIKSVFGRVKNKEFKNREFRKINRNL